MYLNLPYTRVFVKQSFLQGSARFKLGHDPDMLEAYLVGMRATPYEPPLYEVYIPQYNACYDKVMQNAIFSTPTSPAQEIDIDSVAWWDCLSDNISLYRKNMLTNCLVTLQSRKGHTLSGQYLFTVDFNLPYHQSAIHMSESKFWPEHKSANYFFDDASGVFCCGPNNKMRWIHSSLGTPNAPRPPFSVFDPPPNFSHEEKRRGVAYSSAFDYTPDTPPES